jgi:hypothetical protein
VVWTHNLQQLSLATRKDPKISRWVSTISTIKPQVEIVMSTQEPTNSLLIHSPWKQQASKKVTYKHPLKLNLALPENTDCNIYKPPFSKSNKLLKWNCIIQVNCILNEVQVKQDSWPAWLQQSKEKFVNPLSLWALGNLESGYVEKLIPNQHYECLVLPTLYTSGLCSAGERLWGMGEHFLGHQSSTLYVLLHKSSK